jgi:4-hydroxy-tetrahydrodipicolinate synthase
LDRVREVSEPSFRGVYVPIITPFSEDGAVAADALEALGHRLLDDDVAGLVPLGTAGEGALLEHDERRLVIDVCARVCGDRGAQLIVGAGSNNTQQTAQAVRELSGTHPLAGLLCLVPYYLRPTQAGIRAHFEAVADASSAPIVVYNIPFRTGVRASAETLLALAEHPNIAGTKHSVGAIDDDTELLLAESPPDFAVLSGDDGHLAAITLLGGAGGITASAHVCTRRWVALVAAALDSDAETARAHQTDLLPVVEAGFREPSPAVFKGVLYKRGEIPSANVRLPFLPASDESVSRAMEAIERAAKSPANAGLHG